MSKDPALIISVLCAISLTLGALIGSDIANRRGKDVFMKYCTNHGDTFEACQRIWSER